MKLCWATVAMALSLSGTANSADRPAEQLRPSSETSKRCAALASNDRIAAMMRDNGQPFDLAMSRINMVRSKDEREAGRIAISNAYIAHPEVPAPRFYDFSYRLCLNANLETDEAERKEKNAASSEEASYRVERGAPVKADQIVGSWTCGSAGGSRYLVSFNRDSTYHLNRPNGTQSRGAYSIEGNLLSRKESQGGNNDIGSGNAGTTPIALTEDGSLYFVNTNAPNLTERCEATTATK